MEHSVNIKVILDMAIAREEEAYTFYTGISERQSNPAVKQTFDELAQDELGHKKFLQACMTDPALLSKVPLPTDYKVAEATDEPDLSFDMKPADALALAMQKELSAAQFYQGLAAAANDPVLSAMFSNLARMELGHKTRIENLFVDIGYPEAF